MWPAWLIFIALTIGWPWAVLSRAGPGVQAGRPAAGRGAGGCGGAGPAVLGQVALPAGEGGARGGSGVKWPYLQSRGAVCTTEQMVWVGGCMVVCRGVSGAHGAAVVSQPVPLPVSNATSLERRREGGPCQTPLRQPASSLTFGTVAAPAICHLFPRWVQEAVVEAVSDAARKVSKSHSAVLHTREETSSWQMGE